MAHQHEWLIDLDLNEPVCLAPGHKEGYPALPMGTAWSRDDGRGSDRRLATLAAKMYHSAEVKELLEQLERQILTHNETDFVSVGATNFVAIIRVLQSFDEARKKISER